ncbi:MAG: hypothetical protein N7Q72_04245, partial [Spiroplasma sp. Tabriz.8]|nr:hypothetical protein [Spiroplasma sp. Tabriz.8]
MFSSPLLFSPTIILYFILLYLNQHICNIYIYIYIYYFLSSLCFSLPSLWYLLIWIIISVTINNLG